MWSFVGRVHLGRPNSGGKTLETKAKTNGNRRKHPEILDEQGCLLQKRLVSKHVFLNNNQQFAVFCSI